MLCVLQHPVFESTDASYPLHPVGHHPHEMHLHIGYTTTQRLWPYLHHTWILELRWLTTLNPGSDFNGISDPLIKIAVISAVSSGSFTCLFSCPNEAYCWRWIRSCCCYINWVRLFRSDISVANLLKPRVCRTTTTTLEIALSANDTFKFTPTYIIRSRDWPAKDRSEHNTDNVVRRMAKMKQWQQGIRKNKTQFEHYIYIYHDKRGKFVVWFRDHWKASRWDNWQYVELDALRLQTDAMMFTALSSWIGRTCLSFFSRRQNHGATRCLFPFTFRPSFFQSKII